MLTLGVRPESAPIGTRHPLAGAGNGANPTIPANPNKCATVFSNHNLWIICHTEWSATPLLMEPLPADCW